MEKEVRVPSNIEIPIFILVRDRLNDLREALSSYKTLSSRWYAIICDHNSTYPPLLKYLADLKASGVEVWYIRSQTWEGALKEMATNIKIYLKLRPHLQYYVVTDPDISLNHTAPDLLLFQAAVLKACPSIQVIGPSLQISNIPDYYTKKAQVYKRQSPFWTSVPATATWDDINYHIAIHPIDTTFALRRSTTPFVRLEGLAARTYAPYMATHLPWYMNNSNPSEDYLWYLKYQLNVNHWR
jgi:hypothetical protein